MCSILWALASHGPLTVTEIVQNDGYSQGKSQKKTRWDTYNRIIGGKQESVRTLMEKELVYEFDKIDTSKPTQRYSLTLFGAFYAISLFSGSLNTLDKVAASHSHLLPLVFGKWDMIKKNTGFERGVLRRLANIRPSDNSTHDPLLNRRALSTGRNKVMGSYADELSLYFFSKLSSVFHPKVFSHFIKMDDDIFKWYSSCMDNLLLVNNLDKIHIKYVKSVLDGNIDTAKSLLKKHSAMQGIS